MKKYLLRTAVVALVLAALITAGYIVYSMINSQRAGGGVAQTEIEKPSPAKPSPLKIESRQSAFDYWVNSKTNGIYYLTEEGKVIKRLGEGQEVEENGQILEDLNSITLSADGTKIIAEFNYPINPVFAVYDVSTNGWQRLPEGTVAATFDPSGSQIAFLKRFNGVSSLNILNLATKKVGGAIKINFADTTLAWKDKDEIYFIPRPTFGVVGEVWRINLKDKALVLASRGQNGFAYMLSDKDDLALKLTRQTLFNAALALTTLSGEELLTLPFTTLPSKCAFSGKQVYCAVPQNIPQRTNLLDDYLKEKLYTQDTLVSYDTSSGALKEIYKAADLALDAEHLTILADKLFLKNRIDGRVYSVEIK